jgi:hypothetical protein
LCVYCVWQAPRSKMFVISTSRREQSEAGIDKVATQSKEEKNL